jgi:Plasmid pRiA4b ORF-3-like protein
VDDLEAVADKAVLVGQLRSLLGWLGDGRRLTKTGRLKVADARALVELLGTGDELDPDIGGRVYETRSSEKLPGLTRIVGWARGARLVRVNGGRLVPVKKNAALPDKPLELVLALLAAFPWLGDSMFSHSSWRGSLVGEEFGDIGPAILTMLLGSAGPVAMSDLYAMALQMIVGRYVLDELSDLGMEVVMSDIDTDVTTAVTALAALGVARLDQGGTAAELTPLGRAAIRRVRGMAQAGDAIVQLVVRLEDVADPLVWRRVLVPAAYPLSRVHEVIQVAMGWEGGHLHLFRVGRTRYGPASYLDEMPDLHDEAAFRLGDVVRKPGSVFLYEYDFGDGWEHSVAFEALLGATEDGIYPACVAGAGACPPEDCGGASGFADLKETLAGPPSAERDFVVEWAGADYDPTRFDLAAANVAVAAL